MNTHANIQHHHLLIKINSNTAASGVLYVFLMVMAFMEASASPCWCTTAIAYARKASQSYFCRFPLSSPCPHAASSEVVELLLRGLMWYHISAVCWWHVPISDKAAPLWGQELPQLVLPERGVLMKPWCGLRCGELEHENGHEQIKGESDLTEVTVSFSWQKYFISFGFLSLII